MNWVVVVLLLVICRLWHALGFYRSYFEQKQRNMGKDPRDVLKSEFPKAVYWLVFR